MPSRQSQRSRRKRKSGTQTVQYHQTTDGENGGVAPATPNACACGQSNDASTATHEQASSGAQASLHRSERSIQAASAGSSPGGTIPPRAIVRKNAVA